MSSPSPQLWDGSWHPDRRVGLAHSWAMKGKLSFSCEAERLERRTKFDLAMIREIGYTNGIENYSRHLSFRAAGEPPDTLLDYFTL